MSSPTRGSVPASEEARYDAIFHTPAIGVVELDPGSGACLRANEAFCTLLGYSTTELNVRPAHALVRPEDLPALCEAHQGLLRGDYAEHQAETAFIRKDGTLRRAHCTIILIRQEDGTPYREIALLQDLHAEQEAMLDVKVQQRTQEAQRLSIAVARAEQRERRRLAEVLHDHVQQLLYGLHLRLHHLQIRHEGNPLTQQIREMEALVSEALDMTRTLTVDLSPPKLEMEEGLTAAMHLLAEEMRQRHGLHVTVTTSTERRLADDEMNVLLYQLVRELLFNVVKHAQVKEARIHLAEQAGAIRISVMDEGKGFAISLPAAFRTGGFGLLNMREKLQLFGGQLDIETAPGKGTTVHILMPLE